MIKMRGISRTFGRGDERTEALRLVDLDVAEGEFLTVMGPSGCGKSTLLSVVGMLDGEWRGEYHLFDHAVHELKHKRRADISVLAGGGKEHRVETSNAGENDLAAFLLVRGHLEGQL